MSKGKIPNINIPPGFDIIEIEACKYPFVYRLKVGDDFMVKSIFQNEEYLLPLDDFQPKLILDCGGNIGCAAVYFANKSPNAKIYSVEPEENNFQIMELNTQNYKNVTPIKSAL